MTNEEKLKANIAAARFLGRDYKRVEIEPMSDGSWKETYSVDLSNPSDCLDVVIKLGDKYNVVSESFEGLWCFILKTNGGVDMTEFKGWLPYQEAIAAAVLEVMKDE